MYELLLLSLTITTHIYLTEGYKEEKCTNEENSSFELPQDGQAFYVERGFNTGNWYYSTPDGWIRRDELPKDKLISADDNWPMWIWHDCGRWTVDDGNTYDFVCIESGRYPDYYAYTTGSNLAISYSASPTSDSDWDWTFWRVNSVDSNGYFFLCNFHDSPSNNCDGGFGGYAYIPPTCAGFERVTCCTNLDCSFSYEYGITKTRGESLTTTFEASATVSSKIYLNGTNCF